MNPDLLVGIVTAGLLVVGLIGSILALTFRIGVLSGKVDSFMATTERDRAEMLKDIGRIDERFERHLDRPHGGTI